jgi:Acetyltransferase (GNAT) family
MDILSIVSDRMAEIRPLDRADLQAVTALLGANLPAWTAEGQIPQFLQATLFDHPWADPELPSLVAAENGKVVGFIGAQVRRFRFEDRTLRAVCASHLTVDPDHRGGAAGALLLRRLLTGGQDFTFSDTANDEMARMCLTFGGQLDHARACDWMIVLRPVRWLRALTTSVIVRRGLGPAVPVGALPFKAVRPGGARRGIPDPQPDVRGENADAATIVEQLAELGAGFRLRADYDRQFLEYMFGQAESHFGRPLVRRLVRRGERPVGWYAYRPQRGNVARVLHMMANDRDGDAVLAELVAHAGGRDAAVIAGRLEPQLTRTLSPLQPVLGFALRPWVHCHDPEIFAALASSGSLLTRLDGEWFL